MKPCSRCSKPTANTCITCPNPLCQACADNDPMCADCREKIPVSEVARIRAEIQAEYEAASQGLEGLAQVAQHAFITAKMERIGELADELKQLGLDEDEAGRITAEAMDAWLKGDKP